MRDFILNNCPTLLWIITCIHLAFLFILFDSYKKTKKTIFLVTALITIALLYDSFVLALGGVTSNANLIKSLSQLRYICHGALIPLLFVICAYALNLHGNSLKAVWVFTIFVSIAGILEGAFTVLELKEVAGVIRYIAADTTPSWANTISTILSYGTVIPLMIVGIYCWIKQKTPALFLSGFLMFAFSALGPATGNFDLIFFISMPGEVLMILFFYLYAIY